MDDLEGPVFDLDGILSTANNGRRRSSIRFTRRRLSGGRSLRRANYQDKQHVQKLPTPTVSQRRRGSAAVIRKRPSINNALLAADDDDASGGFDQEITNEELYQILSSHNNHIAPGRGTLRLPSDVLHRRKSRNVPSRFDTEDLAPLSNNSVVDGRNNKALTITDVAMMVAREREEEDVLLTGCAKGYKNLQDFYQDTTILKRTLSRIQGRYGTAIMEYFSFVKWLILLNLFITLMTLPIILPQYLLDEAPITATANQSQAGGSASKVIAQLALNNTQYNSTTALPSTNVSRALAAKVQTVECTLKYKEVLESKMVNVTVQQHIVDFIQGSGLFETKTLFHGNYFSRVYSGGHIYEMDIAFLVVVIAIFVVSLVLILNSLSTHQKTNMVNTGGGEVSNKFSAAILSSWDYGLTERSAVKIKKGLIKQELQQLLADADYRAKVGKRTTRERVGLWIVRSIINIIVIAILGLCVWGIIEVQAVSVQKLTELKARQEVEIYEELTYEYLPTIVITGIYLVVPVLFNVIVTFEKYRPTIEINLTMARILILRLLSLMFLLLTNFINLTDGSTKTDCKDATTTLGLCWETYMGQQIYKLVILDFAVLLGITFLMEYPRQAIVSGFSEKNALIRKIGQQEFDMPKNVMDVLYNQTLCWIGVFFSPFIPFMITIKMVLFFIIKRASLFKNQKPSPTLSKSSAVYAFFLWVMLFSLLLAYIVLIIYMQFTTPSQGCGPFRVHSEDVALPRMIDTLSKIKAYLPTELADVIDVINSPPVAASVVVFLCVLWYFYVAINNGLSAKAKLYIEQLSKNVMDKQFILGRVNRMIHDSNNVGDGVPRMNRADNSLSHSTERCDEPDGSIAAESTSSMTSGVRDSGNINQAFQPDISFYPPQASVETTVVVRPAVNKHYPHYVGDGRQPERENVTQRVSTSDRHREEDMSLRSGSSDEGRFTMVAHQQDEKGSHSHGIGVRHTAGYSDEVKSSTEYNLRGGSSGLRKSVLLPENPDNEGIIGKALRFDNDLPHIAQDDLRPLHDTIRPHEIRTSSRLVDDGHIRRKNPSDYRDYMPESRGPRVSFGVSDVTIGIQQNDGFYNFDTDDDESDSNSYMDNRAYEPEPAPDY